MARDPGSVWKPLPEAGAPDGYRKDKFIVHSTGSNGRAEGTWQYFAAANVVNESTFIIGVAPDDPTLQIMDSTDNADANLAANQPGISVEVVGDGQGGYNAWQRSELIRVGRWAAANHPIARQVVPTPTGSGFGWHIMFGSPGPWTAVKKICPGPVRIQQLKSDIFPAIFSGTSEEDDMTPDQAQQLAQIHGWIRDDKSKSVNILQAILYGQDDVIAMLKGNNPEGQNNFHWLAAQVLTALAAQQPGGGGGAVAIASAVPADLAAQVADELVKRLQS